MFTQTISRTGHRVTSGLTAGTLVEGPNGWLPVEDLRLGDAVHSYDGGLVRVLGLDRHWIAPSRNDYLLNVPGGALDNCSDLLLLPGQHLLIDTLQDAELPDAIVVLIPAASFEGWLGVRRVTVSAAFEVVTPRFADDEAIFANSGTLLHCPGIRQDASATTSDFFTRLNVAQAQSFLSRIYGTNLQQPLRRAA